MSPRDGEEVSSGGLYAELKRRNVFRVAAAYIVIGWLTLQVADVVLGFTGAPAWVGKTLIALLLLGFIPALGLAWVFEIDHRGVHIDTGEAGHEGPAHHARRLDTVTLIAVFGVVVLMGWQHLAPAFRGDRAASARVADSEPAAASSEPAAKVAPAIETPEAALPEPPAGSIAVLPFADLSQAGDQAYFSDGIAEEILNALVKVNGLQVASRTSSFGFRGQEALGVPAIADKLAVRHILEGSVRRAGSTLRITAQLIDAQTDRHLWSETYDRPLTAENVFAIQEEIAKAIVAALKASLGVPEVGSVALGQHTANLGAYDLYLQARALFLSRRELARAEQLLEQALQQDPSFARAWELRAAVNLLMYSFRISDLGIDELYRRCTEFAERALALDPQSSLALAVLARVRGRLWSDPHGGADYATVIADLERAIEIDPHNLSAMNWLGLTHALLGDIDRALSMFQRCLAVDRLFGPCADNEYDMLWVLGRSDEAYAHMLDVLSRSINVNGYANFHLLAKFEERTAFLLVLHHSNWLQDWRRGDEVYEAFRHPERDHAALRDGLLQHLANRERNYYSSALLVPLGAFGEPPPAWQMWAAEYRRYRQSTQFRQFIERSGALAYWRAKGFPSQCRALPPDSFECD